MILPVLVVALVLVAVLVPWPVALRFALVAGVAYGAGRFLCPRGLDREEEAATSLVCGSTLAGFLWIGTLALGLSAVWVVAVLVTAAAAGALRPLPPLRGDEQRLWPATACLLSLGALGWTQFGNGSVDPSGALTFYGSYVPEALVHCALSQELRHSFPPEFPAGEALSYHVLYNSLAAMVAEGTGASMLEVHYRLLPVAIVSAVVLAVVAFVRRVGGSPATASAGVLFLFFADDLSWLLVAPGLVDPARASNGILGTLLGAPVLYALHHNRAFLLGVAGFLVALSLAARALERRDRHSLWAAALLTAALAEVKIFYPFLVLGTVGLYWMTSRFRRPDGERGRSFALLMATTIALTLVMLLLFSGQGIGASPGDFLFPGYVGLVVLVKTGVFADWEALRSAVVDHPLPILVGWLPLALVLFTAGTLGVRALGLVAFRKATEHRSLWLMAGGVVVGYVITLTFVTPPAPLNVVYFWGVALCLLSVLAGVELCRRVQRGSRVLAILVAVLALPGTLYTLRTERSFFANPRIVVSDGTRRAADFLRHAARKGDVLLESNVHWSLLPAVAPVRPVATWYHWWENAFGREERIRRLEDVADFFRGGDPDRMREVLNRYDVTWVRVAEGEDPPGLGKLSRLERVLSADGLRLYRVLR